jgi:hypothetical protein
MSPTLEQLFVIGVTYVNLTEDIMVRFDEEGRGSSHAREGVAPLGKRWEARGCRYREAIAPSELKTMPGTATPAPTRLGHCLVTAFAKSGT